MYKSFSKEEVTALHVLVFNRPLNDAHANHMTRYWVEADGIVILEQLSAPSELDINYALKRARFHPTYREAQ